MTDDSATPTPPAESTPAKPAAPWKRYIGILVGVVILAGIAYAIWGDRLYIAMQINGLHSNDGRTRAAHVKNLRTFEDKALVIEMLAEAVADEGKAFEVRKLCADLLHRDFNRLPVLENLLRTSDSILTRGIILRSLMVEPYFLDEIATEPAFRVRGTVESWLLRSGDLTRSNAVQLAVKLDQREALPLIKPLVERSGSAMAHPQDERNLMIASAGALLHFKECEALPRLLEVAAKDPDFLVRLRFMQIVDNAAFRGMPSVACPGAVSDEAFAAHVRASLDDKAHEVRMGAMLILVRHPAWARPAIARLREILDGAHMAAGRETGPERRHALEVLVHLGEEDDLARVPMACHDASLEVRSTAARSVGALPDAGYEGCWIGLMEDETESEFLWRDCIDMFYKFAKVQEGRIGFPVEMAMKAQADKTGWAQDLASIFKGDELVVAGQNATLKRVSRQSIAKDHFRWWARKLGLEQDDVEKALAARDAFYAAKRRGDVDAAQKALEGAPRAAGLWTYAEGWIAARQK